MDGRADSSSTSADDQTTLRSAVQEANAASNPTYIFIPIGSFGLSVSGSGGDKQGDLDISKNITIIGAAAGASVIDAGAIADRVFDVTGGGVLNISRVTLALGEAPTIFSERSGGGVRVQNGGQLNLDQSAVVGNWATRNGDGGAIHFAALGSGSITNSVITVNGSEDDIGGVYLAPSSAGPGGMVRVGNSIIANNTDDDGSASDVFAGFNRTFTSEGKNRLGNAATGFVPNLDPLSDGDYIGTPDYIVTSLIDTFDGASDPLMMSLRDAIHLANTTAGDAEIWLPAWDFTLTIERTSQQTDIEPSYGDLDIKDSLAILGVKDSTSVAWQTGAAADEVFELLGDYNLDNVVDTDDQPLWHTSDGDDDGTVGGQGDYDAWANNYDATLSIDGVIWS
jgi:hypothetical protein